MRTFKNKTAEPVQITCGAKTQVVPANNEFDLTLTFTVEELRSCDALVELLGQGAAKYALDGGTGELGVAAAVDLIRGFYPASVGIKDASFTSDGRMQIRSTCANRMKNFKLRVICFYTSDLIGGLHCVNPVTDAAYGDTAVRLYDANGVEITTEEGEVNAVKTTLDFEPHYDYEVIGGHLDLPEGLVGGTTDEWYTSAIGVPDYPPQYYGSVDYISEVNLEACMTRTVSCEGRSVSFMPYNLNGMPHTNRLRFIIKHPVGARQRFQLSIYHFTL